MRKTGKTSTVKISRPKVSGIAPRQRLFRLLDSSRKKPIIWITGPAGSGKTTLAASWLDARKLPCLWYQVDEGDGDIATFFYYMGLAAKKAAPRYKRPLPLLTPEYLLGVPTFTRRYFEELFRRLKEPFIVVLDNFQDAASPALREMISHALEAIPEGVNVVVLSRSEPPAELSRLRANDKMALVGWNELSFSLPECRAFLKARGSKTLPNETIRQLHGRTDGWAAGLVLMTEMAAGRGVSFHLISELSREAVFNYFANEIFEKTDAETRDFLLMTSFFPSMSPGAAGRLTGNAGAHAILSRLSRQHYFTDWRSLPMQVFQYHPLFREFLQARAKDVFAPGDLTEIQRRTGAILETEGRIDEAAVLYNDAEAWEYLTILTLAHAETLIAQGRHKTLEEWISGLPREMVESSPWILYWLGVSRLAHDPAEARGYLESAFHHFMRDDDLPGMLLSWSFIVDTFLYEWGDFKPLDRWIEIADRLNSDHPEVPSPEIEARLAASMFNALTWRRPQHPELAGWAEKVMRTVLQSPNNQLRMMLGNNLLFYYLWSGDSAKAAVIIHTLRPLSRAAGNDPLTQLMWFTMEAMFAWLMNDLAACDSAVSQGMQLANSSGVHLLDEILLSMGCESNMSALQYGKAAAFLGDIAKLNTMRPLDRVQYQHLCASIAWCKGDWHNALRHGENAVRLVEESGHYLGQSVMEAALAVALFDAGQKEEAAKYLDRALESGKGFKRVEFCCKIQKARFALEAGAEEEGLSFLREAMRLGARNGYVNFIRWSSDVMSRLCAKALEHGIEAEYVRRLIKKRGLVPERFVDNWPYPVRVHTLGGFEIVIEDKPAGFTGKVQQKPLAMLKTLTALGGKDIAETQLTDILWPDADGDSAHKSFEMTLLRLRRLLGREDTVSLKGGSLSLNTGCCWVDTQSFENLARNAEEVWKKSSGRQSRDRAAEAVRLSEKALQMYKGPFLPNDTDMDCTVAMREKMRNLALQQVVFLGSHWVKARQWQKAIESYRKGTEIDGIFEDFYRCLMACHEKLGQRAEAVRVYGQCRAALSAALGIEPTAETKAIYSKIRNKA